MLQDFVAVPGGAGFIGSHLCERLVAAGHHVLALDDHSTGDARRLEALREHPRFALVQHDIAQVGLPPSLDDAQQIFNLAGPASPSHYRSEPVRTMLTCALGTWRLLESACRSGARLLQASTGEIYGDPEVHPQPEEYCGHVDPIGPRSSHDEGKRCAEAMCAAYQRQRKVDVRIARLFSCYGPRLHPGDGRVVSNFIAQALRGEPLTLYGDGLQTRSFCYVDDTVDALLRLMRAPVDVPVNIGNPTECTVLGLAEKVLRLSGSRSALHHLPLPPDDAQRRRPNITRARSLLGWEPRVTLGDGLRATIDYFRRELGLSSPTISLPPAAIKTHPAGAAVLTLPTRPRRR
jgi:UDP-glucuronate decarboxylase